MRQAGWYWVKWENPGDHPSWCPSWWCEDAHAWWVEECYQEEGDIVEIGPRIPTPDEPWRFVPTEPTTTMICAASDTYMPFGDMSLAIQAAIANAPKPEE